MPTPRRRTPLRAASAAAAAALAAPLLLAGCLAPADAHPVAQSALRHAHALGEAHSQDLAALRAAAETLLDIQRERLLTELQLEFIARWTTAGAQPDLDAFDAALADPAERSALVLDVRHGRLSRDQAGALLSDFCAAEALSDAHDARRALLERLGPVAHHDDSAASLLHAIDQRASHLHALRNELLADAGAVALFTSSEPTLDDVSREAAIELWSLAVTRTLHDPAKRAAAQRLLDRLLALGEQ